MTSRLRVNTIQSSAGLSTITVGASSVSFGDIEASKLTASTGILFGTDTAAANTLDDYEEGTWTPVFEGETTAGTYTYTSQVGSYTKIGNQVTATCSLVDITTSSAGSGSILVTGLPFTSGATINHYGAFLANDLNFDAATVIVTPRVLTSATEIQLRQVRDNTSTIAVDVTDIISGSTSINCQVIYTVD